MHEGQPTQAQPSAPQACTRSRSLIQCLNESLSFKRCVFFLVLSSWPFVDGILGRYRHWATLKLANSKHFSDCNIFCCGMPSTNIFHQDNRLSILWQISGPVPKRSCDEFAALQFALTGTQDKSIICWIEDVMEMRVELVRFEPAIRHFSTQVDILLSKAVSLP